MKAVYQYALAQSDWIAVAVSVLTAILILQGWKVLVVGIRWAASFFRSIVLKFTMGNLLLICFCSAAVYAGRFQISDVLRSLEPAVYFGQFGSDAELQALIFEQELDRRNLDMRVTDEVKRVTKETASALGVPRLWLYQCALTECGLKPFTVRQDRIAGSWSQLTAAGLSGIKINDRSARMQDVFDACQQRDIETVMAISKTYLIDRWILQGSPALSRPVDAYLLLFAPAFVGKALDAVLYEGYGNPSYYKNAGLDGWTMGKGGRIIRKASAVDGKITVRELGLIQEYKKNELLKQYLK